MCVSMFMFVCIYLFIWVICVWVNEIVGISLCESVFVGMFV